MPNARFLRTIFFNKVTPKIYEAAAEALGPQFESYLIKERREEKEYLIKERRERWSMLERIGKMQNTVKRISSRDNEIFIARLRVMPVPSKPADATSCKSALAEIEERLQEIMETKTKMETSKQKLFAPETTGLQSWASEQFDYVKGILSDLDTMIDCLSEVKKEVQETNEKLAAIFKFKLVSAEKKRKRKSKADNARKSTKRKKRRAITRAWDMISLLVNENLDMEEFAELSDTAEGNSVITVKRPLDLEQLNIEFLNQATPKSYYNGLLTLKTGLFASSCEQLIDNALDRMQNKTKQFKSYGTNEDDTESISVTSGNEESNSSSRKVGR